LVTPLIADTTVKTSPRLAAEAVISAAARMRAASPTDVPPNFITLRFPLIEFV
jgi:hypothetical protein